MPGIRSALSWWPSRSPIAATVVTLAIRFEGTPRSRHCPTAWRLTPNSLPSSVSVSSKVSAIGSSRVGGRTGLLAPSQRKHFASWGGEAVGGPLAPVADSRLLLEAKPARLEG